MTSDRWWLVLLVVGQGVTIGLLAFVLIPRARELVKEFKALVLLIIAAAQLLRRQRGILEFTKKADDPPDDEELFV